MKAKKSKIIGMVIVMLCSIPLVLDNNTYADMTEEEVLDTVTTTEVSTRADSLDSLVLNDVGDTVTGYDSTQNPLGTRVVIPSHNAAGIAITVIGESAFLGNTTIEEVVLPDTITTISNKAFESSTLSKINLPSGVSIGSYSFSETKITNISIPGDATIAGATYAFYKCRELVNVIIGEGAFGCTKLSKVDIPGSIGTLQNNVFENCKNLTEVTIGEGVTEIGHGTFYGCQKLEKVTISSTVTSIGASAFEGTPSLKQITLPSGLQTLGERAFFMGGLTSIEIPQGITTIPTRCFIGSTLASVTLSEGLLAIGEQAFENCSLLENINIPSTVTSIGSDAFSHTKSLKQITLPNGLQTLGRYAFHNSGLTSIEIPQGITTIPEYCFFYSQSLTSVTLPEGLTTIGPWDFRITSLLYVDIPSTVTSVVDSDGCGAFSSQNVTGEIIYKDGKYMFPLPKEMNLDKVTVKTEGVVLDKVNKRLVMDSALETVVYDYAVSNATHTFTPMDVTLTLSLKESTVTFKDDVGTVLDTVFVSSGQAGSTTVVPFKEGYTFIGWDKDVSCVIEDMVVTARFKELPIVTTKEAFIKVNSKFDPLTYIKAIDAEGKRITEITIINSTVDMTIEGIYVVEFEVVDRWGGKVVSSLQVEVYKDLEYRTIIDPLSSIEVGGYLHQEARLIVEYLEIEKNELNTNIEDQVVVGSYEARIEGKYVGKLTITFPIDIKYEGEEVYIKHLKHNGEIESFTRTCKDGQVSIEVKELSPFMVSVEKEEESLVTMTKDPTTPLYTGNPMKPLYTGNQSKEEMYLSVLVITSIVFIIVVRKRRKQER